MALETKSSNKKVKKTNVWMREKLLIFSIFCLFIGANVLVYIGYMDYNEQSFIRKVFPASYLALIVFLMRPSVFINNFKEERRLLVTFFILVVFNMLTGREIDVAMSFNSLLLPVFFSVLLYTTRINRKVICRILISCYLLECIVAIIERIMLYNFFPLIADDGSEIFSNTLFRSTALLNHPLENALTVSVIMSFILISRMSICIKMLLWGVGFVALLCFNTRFAIICNIVCVVIYATYLMSSSATMSKKNKKKFLFMLLFTIIGIYILFTSYGFGNRLTEMGAFDESSAGVRLVILSIFDYYPIYSVLLGVPWEVFEKYLARADLLGYTIENYWIIYLFRFGLVFLLLLIRMYISVIKKWLEAFDRISCILVLFIFLFISSSNNSMAASSLSLSIFVVCAYAFSNQSYKYK